MWIIKFIVALVSVILGVAVLYLAVAGLASFIAYDQAYFQIEAWHWFLRLVVLALAFVTAIACSAGAWVGTEWYIKVNRFCKEKDAEDKATAEPADT